jgi:16S rRNA (uracil1498-N3)-methyltransferase
VNIFIAEINNNTAVLRADESWHCAKVLRKKSGEPISVIDGKGNMFHGTLEHVHEKGSTVKITEGPVKQLTRNYYLHLLVAPTKQIDRIEWMLEKAVEIGLDEVTFIQCHNSERTVIKTDRMQRIVESAVKQSLQSFIPVVNELADLKNVLKLEADQKLIAYCGKGDASPITSINFKNKKSCVMIGPEGDFTSEEFELAIKNGFKGLTLGANRLRTETAGLYAVQAVSLLSSF